MFDRRDAADASVDSAGTATRVRGGRSGDPAIRPAGEGAYRAVVACSRMVACCAPVRLEPMHAAAFGTRSASATLLQCLTRLADTADGGNGPLRTTYKVVGRTWSPRCLGAQVAIDRPIEPVADGQRVGEHEAVSAINDSFRGRRVVSRDWW